MPNSMRQFKKVRSRDINIEAGVSDKNGELDYYSFEEPTLNSFDKAISEERIKKGLKLKEIIRVPVFTINDLLGKYMPHGQPIDFITIDVEGYEYCILQSLDYAKFAPKYFLIEELDYKTVDLLEYDASPIYCLLKKQGYAVVAKTQRTVIFRKTEDIQV
ncbi:hypothetical protein AGMMS49546_23020 [Spirochaetia bacterium]|nr:hypothetical protein AGMMS49546_23020 [Spirochaetia bacterium]